MEEDIKWDSQFGNILDKIAKRTDPTCTSWSGYIIDKDGGHCHICGEIWHHRGFLYARAHGIKHLKEMGLLLFV